jgi:hypothetical protein
MIAGPPPTCWICRTPPASENSLRFEPAVNGYECERCTRDLVAPKLGPVARAYHRRKAARRQAVHS